MKSLVSRNLAATYTVSIAMSSVKNKITGISKTVKDENPFPL